MQTVCKEWGVYIGDVREMKGSLVYIQALCEYSCSVTAALLALVQPQDTFYGVWKKFKQSINLHF